MTYTKPEIEVLGDATGVILQPGKSGGQETPPAGTAYDLDE